MDRSVAMAGGTVVAMISLWLCGREAIDSPAHIASSGRSGEPAQLDLSGVPIRHMSWEASDRIVATKFPFFSDDEAKELDDDSIFVTPEKLTPKLAVPKDTAVELPSSKVMPEPLAPATEAKPAPQPVAQPQPAQTRLTQPRTELAADYPSDAAMLSSPSRPLMPVPVTAAVPPSSQAQSKKVAENSKVSAPDKVDRWVIARPVKQQPAAPSPPPENLVQSPPPSTLVTETSVPKPAAPLRPAALGSAVERADKMTAEALELAERGAIFSARGKFLQALRQIAVAQDQVNATTRFSLALNAAQRAMEESHEFEISDAMAGEPVDVSRVVAGHRTEILKREDVSNMTPAAARDRYQQFAVEQLTAAIGGEPAGSTPLYGLGRIGAVSGKANATGDMFGSTDAQVWYHAALMTDSRNFRAAHELGCLYAKRGDWEQARAVLQRAVTIESNATTWSNLAIVHGKLGENDWAAAADVRARDAAPQGTTASKLPPVQWVDADTFAKSTGPNEMFFPQQPKPQVAEAPAKSEPRTASKSLFNTSWLPWKTSQTK